MPCLCIFFIIQYIGLLEIRLSLLSDWSDTCPWLLQKKTGSELGTVWHLFEMAQTPWRNWHKQAARQVVLPFEPGSSVQVTRVLVKKYLCKHYPARIFPRPLTCMSTLSLTELHLTICGRLNFCGHSSFSTEGMKAWRHEGVYKLHCLWRGVLASWQWICSAWLALTGAVR